MLSAIGSSAVLSFMCTENLGVSWGEGPRSPWGHDLSLPPNTLTVVSPTSVRRAGEIVQGPEGVGIGVEESA